MNKIFEVIKGYNIEVEEEERSGNPLFKCRGKESKVSFYLDLNWDKTHEFASYKDLESPLLYILINKGKDEEIMNCIADFDETPGHILVFDVNEPIEYFSKDFWNLYSIL